MSLPLKSFVDGMCIVYTCCSLHTRETAHHCWEKEETCLTILTVFFYYQGGLFHSGDNYEISSIMEEGGTVLIYFVVDMYLLVLFPNPATIVLNLRSENVHTASCLNMETTTKQN